MTREIERKFLIDVLPENFTEYASEEILQGYINVENEDTEVRFRKKGPTFFLTIKIGNGLNREEIEFSITKEQFATLWPLTAGHRIVKRRYKIPYEIHIIGLDIYEDRFNGLMACEVEFPTEKEASKFNIPAWFGPEVTDEVELQNNRIALQGIDQKLIQKYGITLKEENIYLQSGVVAIRKGDEALIVTSRKNHWIFPKGIIEHGLSAEASAQKEAFEEAGITGDIHGYIGEYQYEKWGGICQVKMFTMINVQESAHWPEEFRKKKWVKLKKLSHYVKKDELQPIINETINKYSE